MIYTEHGRFNELRTDLSPLTYFIFCISNTHFWLIKSLEVLAREQKNLELIQFTHASLEDILPFNRHSSKLKTIVLFCRCENDESIFNIRKLNEERSTLINPRKVIVYVQEHVYL